jgi:hypothetical protein
MRSPRNPECGYVCPQADRLQHPNANGNYNDDVQDRLDTGSHGNVSVDQIQGHPNYDQDNHKIY